MLIDSHMHLWSPARGDYGWLTPASGALYRDFVLDDYFHATERGIDGVLLVQAAPTVAETHWLLDIAANDSRVKGVVGWVDFEAGQLAAQPTVTHTNIVGIRPMLQLIAEDDWILCRGFGDIFAMIADVGCVFDALIQPRHLAVMDALAARFPTLAIVINHAAKPNIEGGVWQPWADDLHRLAARPNVACKLSGLLTQAASGSDPETVLRYARHILNVFGPERVLWGSDWPVLTTHAPLESWHALVDRLLEKQPDVARGSILGGNAVRIYALEDRSL